MNKVQFIAWVNKDKDVDGILDLLERFGCHMVDHKVGKGKYDQMTFAASPFDVLSKAKKAKDETFDIPAMTVCFDAQHNLIKID